MCRVEMKGSKGSGGREEDVEEREEDERAGSQ